MGSGRAAVSASILLKVRARSLPPSVWVRIGRTLEGWGKVVRAASTARRLTHQTSAPCRISVSRPSNTVTAGDAHMFPKKPHNCRQAVLHYYPHRISSCSALACKGEPNPICWSLTRRHQRVQRNDSKKMTHRDCPFELQTRIDS